jgi:putative Ca2+/H+ antiporter (TMEM165/GDT1 family)
MTFHPATLALHVSSILITFMILYSTYYGIRILRRWDIESGSELQLALERRTYLISTLLAYTFGLQLFSLFLFIFTADTLHTLFVGAMCAAGSLFVNGYGYPALILKIITFLLAGLWLILNYADNKGYNYPLIKKKYFFLIIMTPFILAEMVLQWNYFLRLRPDVITSCCGSLFSTGSGTMTSEIVSLPTLPMMVLFYFAFVLTIASGIYFYLKNRRRRPEPHYSRQAKRWDSGAGRLCRKFVHGSTSSPRTDDDPLEINYSAVRPEPVEGQTAIYDTVSGRGGYLFAFLSAAAFLVSILSILSFISLYYYELPTHHCPFCILQKEYGYIGYPLYLSLLAGTVSGMGVGILMPFRKIESLSEGIPSLQKRLALVSSILFALFAFLVTWRMVFSDFIL